MRQRREARHHALHRGLTLRLADFASKQALRESIAQFILQHKEHAHPYRWDQRSSAKVCAWAERRRLDQAA